MMFSVGVFGGGGVLGGRWSLDFTLNVISRLRTGHHIAD